MGIRLHSSIRRDFRRRKPSISEARKFLGGDEHVGSTITVGPTVYRIQAIGFESNCGSPNQDAAKVGAYMPPVDVNTTGNGGDGLPRETTEETPLPPSVTDGILDGLGDAARGIWHDWTTPIWDTAFEMHEAYKQGDIIDAFNVVNPLISVANISLAIDDGDTYSVTRQSVAIGGVTVVG
jgi:hypothetical protein